MKKLIISLLLIVLAIPSLALAQEGKGARRPGQREGARGGGVMKLESVAGKIVMKLEPVVGKMVSLTANKVTIAMPAKSKDAKAKFKHVKVRISDKLDLRGLLAKGLGKKARLLCRKTDKGAWVLVRIKSIEGVEVPRQGPWWGAEARERLHEKSQTISSEQFKRMENRFRAMAKRVRENPELREELRNLAKKDFEAFRQRIRRIHGELSKSIKGDGPKKSQRRPEGKGKPPGTRRGQGPQARGPRRPVNPQIAKLEQQSQQLAKRYRKAEGQDKEELGDKLRGTLSEVFKLKVRMQAKQVERLEKQLERLREGLKKREHNREDMIQKRFGKLTGEEEDLPW